MRRTITGQIWDTPNYFLYPSFAEQALNIKYAGNTFNGMALDSWSKNSLVPHQGGLVSIYYLIQRKLNFIRQNPLTWLDTFKNFRAEIGYPPDYPFMLDSGGWELSSGKSKNNPNHEEITKILTPQNVLAIAEAVASTFTCPIIVPILDKVPYKMFPPEAPNDPLYYDPVFFNHALQFTDLNTDIMVANPKSPMVKLYDVYQGKNADNLDEWSLTIDEYIDKVDGHALAPKPNNYKQTFMYIRFALEHNFDKPLHFFGISGFNSLALIIYLLIKDETGKHYYPHLLTSDSTSHDAGARYRKYIVPGYYLRKISMGRDDDAIDVDIMGNEFVAKKKNPKNIPLNHLPCICPACSKTTLEEMRSDSNEAGILISLHNLFMTKEFIEALTALVVHPKSYRDYVFRQNIGAGTGQEKDMEEKFDKIDDIILRKRSHNDK